jgi:hypothetical protein
MLQEIKEEILQTIKSAEKIDIKYHGEVSADGKSVWLRPNSQNKYRIHLSGRIEKYLKYDIHNATVAYIDRNHHRIIDDLANVCMSRITEQAIHNLIVTWVKYKKLKKANSSKICKSLDKVRIRNRTSEELEQISKTIDQLDSFITTDAPLSVKKKLIENFAEMYK